MARGNDQETPLPAPRKNPLAREIKDKTSLPDTPITDAYPSCYSFLQKERGAKNIELLHLEKERLLVSKTPKGYILYELLNKKGEEILYSADEGLGNTKPNLVLEKTDDQGTHRIEKWIKRRLNYYFEDSREEWLDNEGRLHSANKNQPALIVVEHNGRKLVQSAFFYHHGQLLKKIVHIEPWESADVTGGSTIEFFDANDKLHSFDGFPARISRRYQAEWYQHGELTEEVLASEYDLFYVRKNLFPRPDLPEVDSYISRAHYTRLENEKPVPYYILLRGEEEKEEEISLQTVLKKRKEIDKVISASTRR